ncbi:MAG TPA: hypothetical protein DCZ94_00535 [Lentisphaeria bacterium]|nr:MAG: hypothetical protein A2X48_12095 [Lentisphaerae bacterium GWF2_49_21]HBC85418.1 hypothetical protein [Lentisphaeria bacterium]
MVISGLNRFFARHGRIIFGTFTGAIIVSFVLYFSPGFSFFGLFGDKQSEGASAVILGKKVTDREISDNVDSMSIMESLKAPGFNIHNSPYRDSAYKMAQFRIMYLRAARERNIYPSDTEVADFLRAEPIFQKNGKFDSAQFDLFVKLYMTPFRYNKQALDTAVREQLSINRLREEIGSGVIVTPDEVRQAFNIRFEKFKIKTMKFKADDYLPGIQADDKSVETFFNANAEKYSIPPKFKVKVVRFNYVNYAGQVKISDEKIKKYYEDNKSGFKEKDEILPLEKVADKIKKTLAEEEARNLAMKDAQAFSAEAYQATADLKSHKAMVDAFCAFAEKKNVNPKVYEAGFFSIEDPVIKNVGREPELAMEVSKLFTDQPVSDAVQGNNACFVACLVAKEETRPAKFDEVKEKAIKDFKSEKARQLAGETARNTALKISEALEKSKKIEEIPEGKFTDLPEFDMLAPPQDPDAMLMAALATETRPGKISTVRETPYGAIFIYLEKRTLPSDQEFKEKENLFTEIYASMKTRSAWDTFENSLAARCQFPVPEKESQKTDGAKKN